jgi:hypothetical protein
MARNIKIAFIPIAVISIGVAGLSSCSSLGTKVSVLNPEILPRIDTVAVWPIKVIPFNHKFAVKNPEIVEKALKDDPYVRELAEAMSIEAEYLLTVELKKANLFAIIEPDIIASLIYERYGYEYSSLNTDWTALSDTIGADAILVSEIYFKTGGHGANTYMTLSMYHKQSKELIAESRFNTMWGRSYFSWGLPTVEKTLPDAVEGAVKGLKEGLSEYPPYK